MSDRRSSFLLWTALGALCVCLCVALALRQERGPSPEPASVEPERHAATAASTGRTGTGANALAPTRRGATRPAQTATDETFSPARGTPASAEAQARAPGSAGVASPASGVFRGLLVERATSRAVAGATGLLRFDAGGRRLTRRFTTDARGHFEVRGVAAAAYTLTTRVPGFQADVRWIRMPGASGAADAAGDAAEVVTVTLEAGHALAGRVVDQKGQPIAAARVQLVRRTGSGPGSVRALSADDGSFRFEGLAAGTLLVSASKRGFRPSAAEEVTLPAGASLRIALATDRPVAVAVRDETGAPVEGARVRIDPAGGGRPSPPGAGEASRGRTDAAGQVVLHGLPSAPDLGFRVEVSHVRFVTYRTKLSGAALDAAAAAAGGLEFVLERGQEISGRVVDGDGAPVPNARLTLRAPRASARSLASTASGAFRFAALAAAQRYDLSVDGGAQGYAAARALDPSDPASRQLTLVLRDGAGHIGGVVRGSGGEALARIPVQAFFENHRFTTHTGEDGTFAFESIPEGVYSLRAGSRALGTKRYIGVRTGGESVEVRLADTGSVRGVFTLPGPPAPFAVRLVPRPGAADNGAGGPQPLRGERVYRFSASEREFVCDGLPQGHYDLLLESGGAVAARADGLSVTAGAEVGPVLLR